MIGYYAHSHGSGHCNYANIFAKVFGSSLTVFTDRKHNFDPGTQIVGLKNENPDGTEYRREDFPEPRALHYAPVNMRKITVRNNRILKFILKKKISLLIIDVSVEVAMLARVSSIPFAYVRLQGDRVDLPHLNAYEGASFLLAYFPSELESFSTPIWVREKTVYLGFLSKYSLKGAFEGIPRELKRDDRPVLLHITGFGGSRSFDFSSLGERYNIYGIGPCNETGHPRSGIDHLGIVDDIGPYVKHSDVVMAACGSNITSEILSLGKRFLAVPEERHYHEQRYMADNLHRLGWAVDTSKYRSTDEAVDELVNWGYLGLPTVTLNGLKAFKSQMEFYGYKADRLILEHYRCIGSLDRSTLKELVSL